MSGMQVVSPIWGLFVDKVGPKRSAYTQACLGMIGLAFVTLGSAMLWDTLVFVGFIVVALHCFLGALMTMQLGIYFEGHTSSRVIFLLNTVFDAGSITNLILWGLQEVTGASTPAMLGGYLCVGIVLYLTSMYYWWIAVPAGNKESNISPTTCNADDGKSSNDADCEIDDSPSVALAHAGRQELSVVSPSFQKEEQHAITISMEKNSSDIATTNSEYVCVADRSARAQLISPPFLLLCLFAALNMAVSNWNLMTQIEFLGSLGDDDNLYLTIFTLLTPVSILGSPLIDWSILKLGWSPTLQMINVLGVAFQVIKVTSTNLNVQILGFLIYSFYRAFLYGVTFSFLPTLVGGDVMGIAAGIMLGSGGAANLCLLPAADFAIERAEGNFLMTNIIILCISAPISIGAIWGLGWYNAKEASSGRPPLDSGGKEEGDEISIPETSTKMKSGVEDCSSPQDNA